MQIKSRAPSRLFAWALIGALSVSQLAALAPQKIKSAKKDMAKSEIKRLTGEFTLVASYTHWVNSMCSQGCDVVRLGPFTLAEPLDPAWMHDSAVALRTQGYLALVEMPVTVAGPRPEAREGDTQKRVVFRPTKYQRFNGWLLTELSGMPGDGKPPKPFAPRFTLPPEIKSQAVTLWSGDKPAAKPDTLAPGKTITIPLPATKDDFPEQQILLSKGLRPDTTDWEKRVQPGETYIWLEVPKTN